MNKAEDMKQKLKYDLTAYMFNPELIYNINPAPDYPDEPGGLSKSEQMDKENSKRYLERFRTLTPLKGKLKEKYATGRLY